MIQRFKGITAKVEEWNSSKKLIPDELWCVVVMPDDEIGLKIGSGDKVFEELKWIVEPGKFDKYILKPQSEEPSKEKFLAEDGNYYEVFQGTGELDIDSLIEGLSEKGLEIPTKEEVEWIRGQMYQKPYIISFKSTSLIVGKVPMGTSLAGIIPFTFKVGNMQNAKKGSIEVSEGTWSGGEGLELASVTSANLRLDGKKITSKRIKTVTFTLSGTDIKGNRFPGKIVSVEWTHKIYWGTSNQKTVSGLEGLTNRGEAMQNTRGATCSFSPAGRQYSIIMVPQEIPQTGINIVNKNAPSIDHSYNMNKGDGGTESLYELNINGIIYNVYVSYGTTGAASTAIIK